MISILENALTEVFQLLATTLTFILNSFSGVKLYNDKLATSSDYLSKKDGVITPDGVRTIPTKTSHEGVIACAGTGGGKTSIIAIPSLHNLAQTDSVVIVTDPSRELFAKTSGLFEKKGYRVIPIDFSNPNSSAHWNPFPQSSDGVAEFISILTGIRVEKNDYWSESGKDLLTPLSMAIVALGGDFMNPVSLFELIALLSSNEKLVNEFMAAYCPPDAYESYLGYVNNKSQNTKASILSTAKMIVSVFGRKTAREILTSNDIDLKRLRQEKTVIYLMCGSSKLRHYKTLFSLFTCQLLDSILEEDFDDRESLPMSLFLEEAGVTRLPQGMLSLALSQVRKYQVNITMLLQSISQLEDNYGKEKTAILANTKTQVYFPGQDLNTCRMLESIIGKSYRRQARVDKEIVAPVMTADEIRRLKQNTALMVMHNKPVALLKKMQPYYKTKKGLQWASIPKFELESTSQEYTSIKSFIYEKFGKKRASTKSEPKVPKDPKDHQSGL